ncbi:MAG TPA: hypothetical protein VFU35_00395 [Jatrophihabitans sp.]|nr:hypothetical protein [Jatrophihabitans sp.]
MTRYRFAAVVLGLAAAPLVLAGCTSTVNGKGGPASGPSGSTSKMPTDAKGLYNLMQSAVAKTSSAHIEFDVTAQGQTISAKGDEQLDGGKVTAMKLDETLPGGAGSVEIIVVNGKIYAKVPTSINDTGKPYLLLSKNSSNPQIRQLATSIESGLQTATVSSYGTFAQAADSVQLVGSTTRNGAPATHYTIVMDPAKLPPDYPNKQALVASGVGTIPIQLYIDSQGRPVELDEHFTLNGQTIDTHATLSQYNQPVDISAPPPSEVGVK